MYITEVTNNTKSADNFQNTLNGEQNTLFKPEILNSPFFNNSIKVINENLISDLLCQINQNKLTISQHQKPFHLHKGAPHENSQSKMNLSTLGGATNLSKVTNGNVLVNKMFRSELTEEEKQKIKEVLRQQKKFIKEIKKKEFKYQQQIENDRLKNIEIEEKIKNQKCQQRKQLLEKQREQCQKRQQMREVMIGQGKEELVKVKKSKKLYQEYQKTWLNTQLEEEMKIKNITEQKRQEHRFNLQELKQHERQYQNLSKQKLQQRSKYQQQFESTVKSNLPKIQKSKFYQTLKEEQRKRQLEQRNKLRLKQELMAKKSQFAKMVKENYKPKLDQSKMMNLTSLTEERQNKKPTMLLEEVRNLGNTYMREVHRESELKKLSKRKQQFEKQDSKDRFSSKLGVKKEKLQQPIGVKQHNRQKAQGQQEKDTSSSSYKNYLVELKQKRKSIEVKDRLSNQVSKIMKSDTLSAAEKIERAKLVAKRLEMTDGSHNSKEMVSSINEKMKMLDLLMGQ